MFDVVVGCVSGGEAELRRILGAQLLQESSLSPADYQVLALSEADGRRLRSSELAASLRNQDVVPHTESGPFPAWIGVGGSPQSVIRAAH